MTAINNGFSGGNWATTLLDSLGSPPGNKASPTAPTVQPAPLDLFQGISISEGVKFTGINPNDLFTSPAPALQFQAPTQAPAPVANTTPLSLIPDSSNVVSDVPTGGVFDGPGGGVVAGLTPQQQHLLSNGSKSFSSAELESAVRVGEQALALTGGFMDGALTRRQVTKAINKINELITKGDSNALKLTTGLFNQSDASIRAHLSGALRGLTFLASNFSAVSGQGGGALFPGAPGGGQDTVDSGDIQAMKQSGLLADSGAPVTRPGQTGQAIQVSGGMGNGPITHNGRVYHLTRSVIVNGEPTNLYETRDGSRLHMTQKSDGTFWQNGQQIR